jgi:type VI secretion system secreted protein Hcp
MAVDYFLKLDSVKGESTDAKHKEEIDVLSWSWGVNQTGTSSYGGGSGAGKANFQDVSFVHRIDKASPRLAQICATGEHIKSAQFVARKAGKEQQEYMVWKFTDLLVTAVQPSGSHAEDMPMETVTLNYSKIEYEYKPQKPDGTLEGGVKFTYDLKQNKQ